MATARAHPATPSLPRHYYTTRSKPNAHGDRKGPPGHTQPPSPLLYYQKQAKRSWRPQGPTRPHPATLATTILPEASQTLMATARAHPATPSHPRHYYTTRSKPIVADDTYPLIESQRQQLGFDMAE